LGTIINIQTSGDETFDIFYNDFDQNSTGDIVLSYYNDGEQYPLGADNVPQIKFQQLKRNFRIMMPFL
jgi:predicted metalloprotease with PDZ domain